MSKYGSGFIGLDVKPRRKVSQIHRNRHTHHYKRWLFPVILGLLSLGIIAFSGSR